ncbi:MAG TPA: heterodisulfide reductase-related iron-sulfur binding cluster [Stackebrandtia sp.]|jgi:glycolate oxidase iron-sulfur subunit|uniref:(Fe-S)-binding protein n=1 Tax=Stackebrandtia sp. TaxID=2023065 RepID=UPI002D664D02|nr:heterodisulfide reductase-related iron-sulfur binding cluster [Stackebrandtia sp.]HZE39619.1 heterodisulfide reductase-related iron-sulfur binding cluster [Stackebrandtia sp.]
MVDSDELSTLADACVHCGFCLPTCPTYRVWGQEMDSPRGRIQLIKFGLEGEPLLDSTATHIDRCLGCMACVTACPSGVRYDKLITAKRSEMEDTYKRRWTERLKRAMIFRLFPYPRRLRAARVLLRLAQTLRLDAVARRVPGLSTMVTLAPRLGPRARLPRHIRPQGERRAVVGMLPGCVQREFFGEVNAATARVLAAEGCEVVVPSEPICCGALSLHSGRDIQAARLARRTIEVFERHAVETVIVNVAGCGSSMKEYADLLRDDPLWADRAAAMASRVRDLTEFLDELGPVAERRRLDLDIAYHDACHLAHAQGVRTPPRRLLESIPGVTLSEIADGEVCCGSAGVYNLMRPDTARQLGDDKAANVLGTGAGLVVAANPGCTMQIATALERAGQPKPVAHIAEVLDAAINGTPDARFTA